MLIVTTAPLIFSWTVLIFVIFIPLSKLIVLIGFTGLVRSSKESSDFISIRLIENCSSITFLCEETNRTYLGSSAGKINRFRTVVSIYILLRGRGAS